MFTSDLDPIKIALVNVIIPGLWLAANRYQIYNAI